MTEEKLPASRVITVQATFSFVLPLAATREQIEEWVEYELHFPGGVEMDNPLVDASLDVTRGEVLLTDTELHRHVSVSEGEPGTYYSHHTLKPVPYAGPSAIQQIMEMDKANKP